MIALLMGAGMALFLAFAGTPLFIRFLVRKGYGQFIRDDGPTSHHTKRGTPTMGGAVVVLAVVVSYLLTHLIMWMMNPNSAGAQRLRAAAAVPHGGHGPGGFPG